eukprot:COSAG01_NODE_24_length_37608_cov_19.303154_1_plen_76_part_00
MGHGNVFGEAEVLQTSEIDGHRTFTAMAATDVSAYAIKVKDARRLFMRSSSVRQALEASLHARQVRRRCASARVD